jgi:hypothetical protein
MINRSSPPPSVGWSVYRAAAAGGWGGAVTAGAAASVRTTGGGTQRRCGVISSRFLSARLSSLRPTPTFSTFFPPIALLHVYKIEYCHRVLLPSPYRIVPPSPSLSLTLSALLCANDWQIKAKGVQRFFFFFIFFFFFFYEATVRALFFQSST